MIWLQIPTVFWLGWSNYFSPLLNVHGVNDVRQTEIHTTEPLLPQPSASNAEMAIETLNSKKNHQVLIETQQN